jgi:hypothetical protein
MLQAALTIFFTSFGYVALKAFQQLNVVHDDRGFVLVTSLVMGICEVYLIGSYVRNGAGLLIGIASGVGAGLGCLTSMALRKRLLKGRGN